MRDARQNVGTLAHPSFRQPVASAGGTGTDGGNEHVKGDTASPLPASTGWYIEELRLYRATRLERVIIYTAREVAARLRRSRRRITDVFDKFDARAEARDELFPSGRRDRIVEWRRMNDASVFGSDARRSSANLQTLGTRKYVAAEEYQVFWLGSLESSKVYLSTVVLKLISMTSTSRVS